jgi:putative transposase
MGLPAHVLSMTAEKGKKGPQKRVRPAGTEPARFRYRAYPTAEQELMLSNLFGCTRVAFNDFIFARETAYAAGEKTPTYPELSRALTASKLTPERAWLAAVPAVALQQATRDADAAYKAFFSSIDGTRKGRRMGAPRFRRRKDNRQTARFPESSSKIALRRVSGTRAKLTLTGVPGELVLAWSRDLPSKPSSVTVIREADGRHYVSFVIDRPKPDPMPANGRVVGIDLGLSTLATIVDGDGAVEKVDSARHYRKAEAALARAQRAAALRKSRAAAAAKRAIAAGTKVVIDPGNRRRGESARAVTRRLRVASLHRTVRESRLDGHHKLARRLICENQTVVLETLSITGMARTKLAKSVHDAGWGTLIRLIEEKASRFGRTIVRADRSFPSTRQCSTPGCSYTWPGAVPLDVREWVCPDCGVTHDRDVNAAINLRNLVAGGQPETENGRGDNDPGAAKPRGERATVDEATIPTEDTET